MTAGATFLAGASGRLLPAAVPLRFFGAAAAFHVLAWFALAATDGAWVDFRGGPGWTLAALHLFTLGVLAMTALGAGAQLLPVATRQSAIGARWLTMIWWTYGPALAVLAFGMGIADAVAMGIGAAGVALALSAWAVLLARHLFGARGMPGVLAHAWGALGSLAAVLASGGALVLFWSGDAAIPRDLALRVHVVAAPFGFMGLLALGLSYILVPMFALGSVPRDGMQLASFTLVAAGLLLAAMSVRAVAWASLAAGVALHLYAMRGVLRTAMRKELGRSFVLVRFGWGALAATLACAAVLWWPRGMHDAGAWLVAAALAWLLSVLLGFLQRILPFLASLHAAAARRRGPTVSALTHEPSLRALFAGHLAACALGAVALATGSHAVGLLASIAGFAGAAAFARFYIHLRRRLAECGI